MTVMSQIDFNTLNAALVVTMMTIDSLLYYFILHFVEEKQKKSVYYFTIYFIFTAIAFVAGTQHFSLPIPVNMFISNVLYIMGIFAVRQGVLIRNGLDPIPLLKNKWVYINVFVVVLFVGSILLTYLFDFIKIRVAILTLNAHLILLFTAIQSFKHKESLSGVDKFLKFFIFLQSIFLLMLPLLTMILHLRLQQVMLLLMVLQIIAVFTWTVSLAVVLLLDLLDSHYVNTITDSLTKIYNRAFFNEYVTEKLALNTKCFKVVMFIDIDFFKQINDTYGHDAGDLVIVTVSKLIKRDIGNKGIVARFGGEEFAVFCENIDEKETFNIAEALRLSISSLSIQYEETRINTTVSIGISATQNSSLLINELKKADDALYKAKQTGRNKVCFAS